MTSILTIAVLLLLVGLGAAAAIFASSCGSSWAAASAMPLASMPTDRADRRRKKVRAGERDMAGGAGSFRAKCYSIHVYETLRA